MRYFVLLCVCLVGVPAFGVHEYYSIHRSIRALGMGGAVYGLSNDESALFYNPAGLSFYPGGGEFMVSMEGQAASDALSATGTLSSAGSGGNDLNNIVTNIEELQGKPIYASAAVMPYFISRGFALGILVADPKVDFALLGKGIDASLDLTAMSDSGLVAGFAGTVWNPRLHLGMNTKLLARAGGSKKFDPADMLNAGNIKLADIGGAGGGVDFDLGAMYEFKGKGKWSGAVSLSLNNLLASQFTIARQQGSPPGLVRMVSLGAFYEWRGGGKTVDYVRFIADLAELGLGGESDPDRGARTGSIWKHVNLGVEAPFFGWLYLRAGLHQGNPTGGLGISAYALKLDLATYAEELASGPGRFTSRRWALRLAIGIGAPPANRQPKKKGK